MDTLFAGKSALFGASVAASSPGSGVPTGTITFMDGSTVLGVVTLNGSAQANLLVPIQSAPFYTTTAVYSGDGNFTASTSPVLRQSVTEPFVVNTPPVLGIGGSQNGIAPSTGSSPSADLLQSGNSSVLSTSPTFAAGILHDTGNQFIPGFIPLIANTGELGSASESNILGVIFESVSTPEFKTLPLVDPIHPPSTGNPQAEIDINDPGFDPGFVIPDSQLPDSSPMDIQPDSPDQSLPDLLDNQDPDGMSMNLVLPESHAVTGIILQEATAQPDLMLQFLFAAVGWPDQL